MKLTVNIDNSSKVKFKKVKKGEKLNLGVFCKKFICPFDGWRETKYGEGYIYYSQFYFINKEDKASFTVYKMKYDYISRNVYFAEEQKWFSTLEKAKAYIYLMNE